MKEADILASTYLDTCVIERLQDIEDSETGLTEQAYEPIHEGVLKCAFSQGAFSDLPVLAGDSVNKTSEDQKLFLMPNTDIKKGDRIQVIQSTGQASTLFAKKPFFYPSHTEVGLQGSEIDG